MSAYVEDVQGWIVKARESQREADAVAVRSAEGGILTLIEAFEDPAALCAEIIEYLAAKILKGGS